jgi:septum formation protein
VATASPTLILASGSKARLRVLRDAGFDPQVVVSGADETVGPMTTGDAVIVIAERKATTVADQVEEALVLGCDSMLDLDGESLGKPTSQAEIVRVWARLAGREAQLFTGHCLIDTRSAERVRVVACTRIRFGRPTNEELEHYAATGEPLQMAGGFSIEGRGGPFVESIDGSPTNVLGLSLPHFRSLLAEVGVRISDLWRDR